MTQKFLSKTYLNTAKSVKDRHCLKPKLFFIIKTCNHWKLFQWCRFHYFDNKISHWKERKISKCFLKYSFTLQRGKK